MSNPFIPVINGFLPEPHASLLNGILFGTKATMPKDFYDALVTTGVLHVIALSGMNISILIALTSKICAPFGKKNSIVFTICFITLFVIFVGASPSIVRAAIMGSFYLLATLFGRKTWGLLSLILSALIMLLFNFSLIKDLSFQLSFLATFGILLANKRGEYQEGNRASGKVISWFKENLKMTLSAQLFTVPVILITFHRISLIAPLTNLLTEWVVQPIMILGFVTALVGVVFQPLGFFISLIVWVPLQYFITVVMLLSKVPGASISW